MPDYCLFGGEICQNVELLTVDFRQAQHQSRPASPPLFVGSSLEFSLFNRYRSGFGALAPAVISSDSNSTSSNRSAGGGNARKASVFFSTEYKISNFSMERRVDFHLQRIMKQNRLINFKNSIEGLPIEERIFESLLEIILSSNSLISRRQSMIVIGFNILNEITALMQAGKVESAINFIFGDASGAIASLKHISSSLGQLMWALNSNKEHVKYVAKVFVLPKVYVRSCTGGVKDGNQSVIQKNRSYLRGLGDFDFGTVVPLQERIADMVAYAEETIARCEQLKASIHDSLMAAFMALELIKVQKYLGMPVVTMKE